MLGVSDWFVPHLLVPAIAVSSLLLLVVGDKWHPRWGTACPESTGIKVHNSKELSGRSGDEKR